MTSRWFGDEEMSQAEDKLTQPTEQAKAFFSTPREARLPRPVDPATIPAGLEIHCAACGLVVPSDAPRPASGGDCAFVAQHRLSHFNAAETPAAQHVMAVCTWALIYDTELRGKSDAAASTYHAAFRASRKAHFAASAVRKAMTPEAVALQAQHRRDGGLYR